MKTPNFIVPGTLEQIQRNVSQWDDAVMTISQTENLPARLFRPKLKQNSIWPLSIGEGGA